MAFRDWAQGIWALELFGIELLGSWAHGALGAVSCMGMFTSIIVPADLAPLAKRGMKGILFLNNYIILSRTIA